MNVLPSISRTCAPRQLPLRSMRTTPIRTLQQHLRTLSSATQLHAQPIELGTSTTPASPSDSSSLASNILSRAPTDTTPSSQSQPQTQPSTQPTSTTSQPALLLGRISRTSTMAHTVQLTVQSQTFDTFLQKHYTRPSRLLAHDPHPAGFLREGDVVEYSLFNEVEKAAKEEKRLTLENRLIEKGVIRLTTRKGKELKLADVGVQKRGPKWVVRRVVTPFGLGVKERERELEGKLLEKEEADARVRAQPVKGLGKTGGGRKQQRAAAVAV